METKIPGQWHTNKKFEEPCIPGRLKVRRRQPAGQTLPMKKPLEQGILPRHWVAGEILGTLHTCQNMTKPNGSNLKQLSETVFNKKSKNKKPDWQLPKQNDRSPWRRALHQLIFHASNVHPNGDPQPRPTHMDKKWANVRPPIYNGNGKHVMMRRGSVKLSVRVCHAKNKELAEPTQ